MSDAHGNTSDPLASSKITINDDTLLSNPDNLRFLESRGGDDEPAFSQASSKTGLLHRNGNNLYGSTGQSTDIDSSPSDSDYNHKKTLNRSITVVEQQLEKLHPGSNSNKMGTLEGVFVPTFLNVLSILMFLRFGFILGQTGVLGMIVLLLLSYGINLLTTLSISAISTNGTVRGGGAYYMISRSLGPEFGGSIGVVFYIGQVLNT